MKPGSGRAILTLLLRIFRKSDLFRTLAFHPATPEAQKLFMDSFVAALALYKEKLAEVGRNGKPDLPNTNFDTGEPARPGTYRLADDAAAALQKLLTSK